MTKSVGIVTFGQMRSRPHPGSSRIRAAWLTRYWDEAELFRIGRKYETVIFQKAYWKEFAREFSGLKILDLCDPDFLHWNSRCFEMLDHCNAVVTSTVPLAEVVTKYTQNPVVCIPDRIDFKGIGNVCGSHAGKGVARTAAWFGYSSNVKSLAAAVYDLAEFGYRDLIVISDKLDAYHLPHDLTHRLHLKPYVWEYPEVYKTLAGVDVVINYRLTHGRWVYKSNNKTTLAWALGLPVAHSAEELARLVFENARLAEVSVRRPQVHAEYDVRQSVDDYNNLISRLKLQHNI